MSLIALLTDFGHQDPFVGIMKGVVAGIAPEARVVDLCHDIAPQDIRGGAFALRQAAPYFPDGTIFVAVVDPGVGTGRRALVTRTKRHLFVGPDNGLLSWLPDPILEARSAEAPELFLPRVSSTFHGRDVFAPLAAHLAAGAEFKAVGPAVRDARMLPWPDEEIVAFDRFGNAITSLKKKAARVRYKGHEIQVVRTYADAKEGEPLALMGSSGLIELSVRNGSFAAQFDAKRGDKVHG